MEDWWPSHVNFYAIALSFVLPYLFLFRHSVFPTTPKLPHPSTLLRPLLTILVIFHTLHNLKLLLSPPVNLFVQLNLPLTAPVSAIRVALLEHQRDQYPVGFLNKISPDVELLLTRLASFEARVIYVRYGPYPLSHCTPCVHLSDFALFSLSPTILPYLFSIILVSLLTTRAALRSEWRTPSLVVLTAAFFTEMWWTFEGSVQFRDGKLDGWTHTHTYITRHTLFLILPLLIHHLPEHSAPSALPPFFTINPPRSIFPYKSSDFRLMNGGPQTPQRVNPTHVNPAASTAQESGSPGSPFKTLAGTISSLGATINALQALKWARIAGLRRSGLREKISSYYSTESLDATYARSDEQLRHEAEALGLGYSKEESLATSNLEGCNFTWQGKGDPRGLDGDTVVDDGADEVERAELEQWSPLRAKARKAARELAQRFFREPRP